MWTRSELGDFDAVIERALARAEEGRDPQPFLDEAAHMARDLTWMPCSEHQPGVTGRGSVRDLVVKHLARAVELLGELEPERAQRHAEEAKRLVRNWSCACSRQELSRSGRPAW